jgi:hypothetical protein
VRPVFFVAERAEHKFVRLATLSESGSRFEAGDSDAPCVDQPLAVRRGLLCLHRHLRLCAEPSSAGGLARETGQCLAKAKTSQSICNRFLQGSNAMCVNSSGTIPLVRTTPNARALIVFLCIVLLLCFAFSPPGAHAPWAIIAPLLILFYFRSRALA